jgi:hypothetical protein
MYVGRSRSKTFEYLKDRMWKKYRVGRRGC